MNKLRIIPSILYKNNTIIRGKNFESWRTVGSLTQAIKLYSIREVDELIFLDVEAGNNNNINYKLIDEFADECFMPIVVGGGIKNLNDIENLLKVGADRVCINTEAFKNRNFLVDAIKYFGSQCIVLSVDYKKNKNKQNEVYINSGKLNTNCDLYKYLSEINDIGVGEVLLTSIDRDGTMNGLDTNTLKKVNNLYNFNLIGSGGVGSNSQVLEAINVCNLKAISCSSIFHFTENTPISLKKYLHENGVKVRI